MANTSMIHARVDAETKSQAQSVLSSLGMTLSEAIVLYLRQIAFHRGIPFEVKIPNELTYRLIYHQSRMNHAMLFTGVDVVDDQPRRWRVENSWSNESGRKGFFIMDDSWFDEFMFEIAAHKSYLPEDLQKALTLKPIVLPPWDPMGSLAYREFARTY